ncbi:MAG: MotA/TolQ/ExbB proton channel family protein [Methanosaeta sp. PtaU1.Bin060]|nr:MAG: MotA/TolQ/ExbB proton channel family protein [Methanosaeta sp. PtaU1.Bin060]
MTGVYNTCQYLLYVFSDAMLYPDMIALILLFGWALALVGSMIREFTARYRNLKAMEEICFKASELTQIGQTDKAAAKLCSYEPETTVSRVLRELGEAVRAGEFQLKSEKILQDAEISMDKALEPIRLGIRVGPMLGLMGTLIPLGPALLGLAQGNIKQLSDSLVIAFTTTVVGIMIGGICYGATTIRTRWYRQDLSDLEYAVDILRSKGHEKT